MTGFLPCDLTKTIMWSKKNADTTLENNSKQTHFYQLYFSIHLLVQLTDWKIPLIKISFPLYCNYEPSIIVSPSCLLFTVVYWCKCSIFFRSCQIIKTPTISPFKVPMADLVILIARVHWKAYSLSSNHQINHAHSLMYFVLCICFLFLQIICLLEII